MYQRHRIINKGMIALDSFEQTNGTDVVGATYNSGYGQAKWSEVYSAATSTWTTQNNRLVYGGTTALDTVGGIIIDTNRVTTNVYAEVTLYWASVSGFTGNYGIFFRSENEAAGVSAGFWYQTSLGRFAMGTLATNTAPVWSSFTEYDGLDIDDHGWAPTIGSRITIGIELVGSALIPYINNASVGRWVFGQWSASTPRPITDGYVGLFGTQVTTSTTGVHFEDFKLYRI